jgi:imidazolonepropionase-like amidohydrolase
VGLLASAGASAAESTAAGPLSAYRASRVVTLDAEPLSPGVLLVRGERVEGVLAGGAEIPDGAAVTDLGDDAVILPGFVNPVSSVSGSSFGDVRSGGVASAGGGSPSDARAQKALAALKPEAKVYRRMGRTGYTAFGWLPATSGLFAGQAAVLRPRRGKEDKADDLLIKDAAYLFASYELGENWRDAAARALKGAADAIVKEREEAKKAEEAKAKEGEKKPAPPQEGEKKDGTPEKPPEKGPEGGPGKPAAPAPAAPAPAAPAAKPAPPPPPDPLVQAFKGEIPLFVRLRTPAAVEHFLLLLDELPVKPSFVLVTSAQPPEIVERLRERQDLIRAVVLEPVLGSLWETSIVLNTARQFSERGFRIALVPAADSPAGHRETLFHLAQLVKAGFREREALESVTRVPASLLGLEGRVGVLKKGAAASFAVYGGEPLGGSARLLRVYVDGEEVFKDDPETGELAGEAVR